MEILVDVAVGSHPDDPSYGDQPEAAVDELIAELAELGLWAERNYKIGSYRAGNGLPELRIAGPAELVHQWLKNNDYGPDEYFVTA